MIALSEDMVGSDPHEVVVQGLRSCLALLAQINNGMLFGAHFTTATGMHGMHLALHHIRNVAGGNIVWIGMVSKFHYWTPTKTFLADFFRYGTGFGGPVQCFDLEWGAGRYDVRFTVGINPLLEYRATPDPNPTVITPLPNVFKLTNGCTVLSATNAGHPGAIHLVPANTGGFFHLDDAAFV